MKLTFRILLIPVLFSVFACKNTKHESYIDLTRHDEVSIWELIGDIELVQLEACLESQIAEIKQLIHHDNHYYILDQKSQQLFCFYQDGRFKFKISAQGKGPGEYNYITNFTIDRWNNRIILLDPVMQRVLFFDLQGGYQATLRIPSDEVMGFNKVYAVADTVLLLTSITNEQISLLCLSKNKFIYQDYNSDDNNASLQAFMPYNNVYHFNGETFAMPVFSQEIINLSKLPVNKTYKYDFGPMNNTELKIQKLREELKARYTGPEEFKGLNQAVGKEKFLDHHLFLAFETQRYRMALAETGTQTKHILTDKSTNHTQVFNHFSENVSFLLLDLYSLQEDQIVIYNYEFWDKILTEWFMKEPELRHRVLEIFNPQLVADDDRQIIDNHDPMTDNPFLVVYKFRE